MIVLKTASQIKLMREACVISANALKLASQAVTPGVSTKEINTLTENYIRKCGAIPSFLGYNGFPAAACISVNNEVIHGIPSTGRILKDGDIVSIDIGAFYNGFHGDNAYTAYCGTPSKEAVALCEATKESLYQGIAAIKTGARIGDISSAVQRYVENRGFSVVRDFVGHGVGANLHEDPPVPNYGKEGRGVRLTEGMTLAIEPMVNAGKPEIAVLNDEWTVVTRDGSLSAHFEHTVLITEDGAIIMTKPD